jgi:hypothetical protein
MVAVCAAEKSCASAYYRCRLLLDALFFVLPEIRWALFFTPVGKRNLLFFTVLQIGHQAVNRNTQTKYAQQQGEPRLHVHDEFPLFKGLSGRL